MSVSLQRSCRPLGKKICRMLSNVAIADNLFNCQYHHCEHRCTTCTMALAREYTAILSTQCGVSSVALLPCYLLNNVATFFNFQ